MAVEITVNNFHSIAECLKANPTRIKRLVLSTDPNHTRSPRFQQLENDAKKNGIKLEHKKLEKGEAFLAFLKPYEYFDFELLCKEISEQMSQSKKLPSGPPILILDGLTDPHNLGAILRTAAFMGIEYILLPKDRSVSLTSTVYQVASGGVEHIKIAQITNVVSAIKSLKDLNYWAVGLTEHADQSLATLKLDFNPLLIIGNEEKGIRPLVLENCDFKICLNGRGHLKSLNASVAAALAMEWVTKPYNTEK